jgi:hypothetical protein
MQGLKQSRPKNREFEDCKLRIANRKLRSGPIAILQFAICNLQSPILRPPLPSRLFFASSRLRGSSFFGLPRCVSSCLGAFVALLLLFSLSRPVFAEDTSALINQELDKLVQLQVDGPLPQVLKTIEDKTGVPLRPDPQVYDLLPWGEQTNVTARIENETLRQALTAITGRLGLTFELGPEAVRIEPMPALARLGRRSTVQELEVLDLLSHTDLSLSNDRVSMQQIVDAVDQKLLELKSPFAVEFRPGDLLKPTEMVTVPRGSTMAEALESLDKDTDATWYPWGRTILVLPKETQVRNQLLKTINTRFNGEDITQVLQELSQLAGVHFEIEPGAIQRVGPEFRTVRLVLDNATVRQALESLAGFTGLGYVIKGGEVYIWNQSPDPGTAAVKSDPAIGTIQLGNGAQFFLRDHETPPDIRQYLEYKKQQAFEGLRKMMKDENFQPTTQPATQPSDKDL